MARIEFGCQIPAWHWRWDVSELRDWAQGAEALGADFISMADHVTYQYETRERPITGPYRDDVQQHEVMTTLAWLAGQTSRAALQPNVLVLTQREPVLVAKQAAEIDVLSGGRLRLGLGIGWQEGEYESLGVPFRRRGARMDEAIEAMRACWTMEPINFEGEWTTIREMSMLPKPVTPGGPPLLFGGLSEPAVARAARAGEGWIAPVQSDARALAEVADRLRAALAENGRDADGFALQWLPPMEEDLERTREVLQAAKDAGFTRLGVGMPNYEREGQIAVDQYLRQVEAVKREVWPELR